MWHILTGILAFLIIIETIYILLIKGWNNWKENKVPTQSGFLWVHIIGIFWILVWATFGKFEPSMIDEGIVPVIFSALLAIGVAVSIWYVNFYQAPPEKLGRLRKFNNDGTRKS